MTQRQVSLSFIRAFCDGDIVAIGNLLTEDLRFEGPYHRFDSRDAYLCRLEENPPAKNATFDVLKVFEDGDQVCIFYEYSKPGGSVLIAQWNRFRGDKIAKITLVFDGRNS